MRFWGGGGSGSRGFFLFGVSPNTVLSIEMTGVRIFFFYDVRMEWKGGGKILLFEN